MTGDELRAVAADVFAQLRAQLDADWSVKPEGLEWTCHQLGDHISSVLLSYAAHAAARAERVLPLVGRRVGADDPAAFLDLSEAAAAVLADVVDRMPAGARGYHPAGMADAGGFAAMACDEILVHGGEIVTALGGDFRCPRRQASKVVARLFPWAPRHDDAWALLLWCNGRRDLEGYPAPGPDWMWHAAPVEEWDGSVPM